MTTDRMSPFLTRFFHRGAYDNIKGPPENSLEAFRKAAGLNTGCELDVQLSRDGQVVVFHDDSLKRVCGIDADVCDFDYAELSVFKLFDTESRIPLFSEVLEVLSSSSAPLIVEIKSGKRNDELCDKTLELLKNFKNSYCVESFNPFIVRYIRKVAPSVVRGLLASVYTDYLKKMNLFLAKSMSACRLNFLTKPDFIAYKIGVPIPKRVIRLRKKGVALIGWTSLDPDKDLREYDAVIFENHNL